MNSLMLDPHNDDPHWIVKCDGQRKIVGSDEVVDDIADLFVWRQARAQPVSLEAVFSYLSSAKANSSRYFSVSFRSSLNSMPPATLNSVIRCCLIQVSNGPTGGFYFSSRHVFWGLSSYSPFWNIWTQPSKLANSPYSCLILSMLASESFWKSLTTEVVVLKACVHQDTASSYWPTWSMK